jgi:nicotinate (nicotinamide) nucleotide adenylyltransferase
MASSGGEARQRIGVLGGTFDPIHIGHLIIAEEVRHRLALDRVILVPARVSPLKSEDGTLFPQEQRYAMVELAIEGNPALTASRVDLDRQPPSYTVDTLRLLRSQWGAQHAYWFIMGADSVASLRHWRDPLGLLGMARLAVVSRPGHAPDFAALEERLPGIGAASDVIDGLQIGISSTDIRHRIGLGLPVRYQLPEPVWAYITAQTPPVRR